MSDDLVTGAELAELWGIHPATFDDLARDPDLAACVIEPGECDAAEEGIPEPARGWLITRRDLARSWGINADTVSKWLHEGLRAAIVEEGPRGRQTFDRRLADRWKRARESDDELTLRDFRTCARLGIPALHLLVPLRAAAAIREEVGEERFADVFVRCCGWTVDDPESAPATKKKMKPKRRKKARKKKAK